MFSLSTLRSLPGLRSLSTSAIQCYPKLKTHQGAKKRWRSLPSGKFKRPRAGHQHNNEHKSSDRKNALSQTSYSHDYQTPLLHKMLPYGSRL